MQTHFNSKNSIFYFERSKLQEDEKSSRNRVETLQPKLEASCI